MCLFPECETPAATRGLCKTHYTTARSLVKAGHTSWDILIESGKVNDISHTRASRHLTGKNQQFFLTEEQIAKAKEDTQ